LLNFIEEFRGKMTIKPIYKKLSILLLILSISIGGISFTQDYFEISKNLDIFNTLYRELNVSYVDETKPGALMKTGIDAMLNSLDPYTIYYPENEIEDYRFLMTGEYGGIGATVFDLNGKITIDDPYEGFAAFKAGLRAGDQIVGINGNNVIGKKTADVSSMLKGQAGTPVKLKVIKAGQTTPVEINLVKEEIKTPSVPYFGMLPGETTGYIRLEQFTEGCSNLVKDALVNLKGKGCKSLIFDLRGNPGGLLNEAVNIVNLFVEKGIEVVSTKGKIAEWDKAYLSVNSPIDTQIPVIVLVDETSASASEIVSGALQDLDRAVIVGQRTYGKGLVQQTRDLAYNAKVKVTVAKYYIPSGRCVQALDYSNKDEDGRVEKVPDSLITAFKTKGGRIVYDGAGVMPDIKGTHERISMVTVALYNKYHIFEYATKYYLAHKEIAPSKDYQLKEEEYQDFISGLKGKDYAYRSRIEVEFEELKKQAIEEKYYEGLKNEIEALAKKIEEGKKEDLSMHKATIKRLLEKEIIARYYFQTGKIEYGLRTDSDVALALNILKDENKVKTILTTSEKATKPFNVNKRF
jgi:carboxyl-terminal processing protease